jgi:hypothetical protein
MRGRSGLTFVAVMISIALGAFFLRFAIEHFIDWTISQDESNAQESLKLISTAFENYAKDHLGMYPANLSTLWRSEPPYIAKGYTQMGTLKGYSFQCSVLDSGGYACSALPSRCRLTGNRIFRVTTGGSMATENCIPTQ